MVPHLLREGLPRNLPPQKPCLHPSSTRQGGHRAMTKVVNLLPTPLLGTLALLAIAATASAAPSAEEKAAIIGQPTALIVHPAAITLNGPRAMQQIVVSGQYADGTVRDLTPFCEFSAET